MRDFTRSDLEELRIFTYKMKDILEISEETYFLNVNKTLFPASDLKMIYQNEEKEQQIKK